MELQPGPKKWPFAYKLSITTGQGSKFTFDFGNTCATRCKFLGALPKF